MTRSLLALSNDEMTIPKQLAAIALVCRFAIAVRLLVGPGRGARTDPREGPIVLRHARGARGAQLAPGVALAAVASGRPGLALRVLPVPADVSTAAARALWCGGVRLPNPPTLP